MDEDIKKMLGQLLEGQGKMNSRLDNIEGRIDGLESLVAENTQRLKALEHAVQVSTAQIDKLSFEVAEIKGDVKSIKKDLSVVETITAKNWGDIVAIK